MKETFNVRRRIWPYIWCSCFNTKKKKKKILSRSAWDVGHSDTEASYFQILWPNCLKIQVEELSVV